MNNKEENIKELVRYWLEKSQESLGSARDELKAGRLSSASCEIRQGKP